MFMKFACISAISLQFVYSGSKQPGPSCSNGGYHYPLIKSLHNGSVLTKQTALFGGKC